MTFTGLYLQLLGDENGKINNDKLDKNDKSKKWTGREQKEEAKLTIKIWNVQDYWTLKNYI